MIFYLEWIGICVLAALAGGIVVLIFALVYYIIQSIRNQRPGLPKEMPMCPICETPPVRIDIRLGEPTDYFHPGGLVHRYPNKDIEGIMTSTDRWR